MAELLKPGDPEWWLATLSDRLDRRAPGLCRYDEYYRGKHRLLFASEKFRSAFGTLLIEFADNWCELVIDAVQERLTVAGFRVGNDPKSDDGVWRTWQANDLDCDGEIATTEALINGISYVMVEPGRTEGDEPLVTVEHPLEVIGASAAGQPRSRVAALKKWRQDDGYWRANVYLPDRVVKFRSKKPADTITVTDYRGDSPRSDAFFDAPDVYGRQPVSANKVDGWDIIDVVRNTLGKVPVVPLRNKPRMLSDGQSEIRSVIPVQDACNKILMDMIVASEFAAYPQRYVTGLDLDEDPDTHQVKPSAFDMALDKILQAENPDAKFGQFPAADLDNYKVAVELLVQHIASQTRTPPHYFYLGGQFPSGEALRSAEAGLVAKVRQRMRHFEEGWEEAMRLCLKAKGDSRDAASMETIWSDPEYRTESEHVDATLKKLALGVPWEQLMEDLDYSPQQINRMRVMKAREALSAPMIPQPPAAQPPQGGVGGDGQTVPPPAAPVQKAA